MSVQVSYKKQMVFGMLLLLIVIISFEGILRVYDNYNPNCKMTNSDVFSSIDNELKRSICLDNDRLRWNNSPYLHLEPNQHYTTIDINDDGFRGNEISLEKSSEVYRIFVIGGSTTFGVASSSNISTIPGFLQEYYSTRTELNVEVINAGIPKAFSYTESNYIKNKLLEYDPDLLIIYDGWNDLSRSSDTYYEDSGDSGLFSKMLRIMMKNPYYESGGILFKNYNVWRADTTDHVKLMNFEDIDQRVKLWKQTWIEICEQGKRENFDVIVTLQPLLGTGTKSLTEEEQKNHVYYNQDIALPNYEKYTSAVNELKSYCTNTADLRNSFDHNLETIYFDNGHVGDLGNKIIAEKLFELSLPIVMKNHTLP